MLLFCCLCRSSWSNEITTAASVYFALSTNGQKEIQELLHGQILAIFQMKQMKQVFLSPDRSSVYSFANLRFVPLFLICRARMTEELLDELEADRYVLLLSFV